jgi:hypothetical protein
MTVTHLAKVYGVHRSTIHRWLKTDPLLRKQFLVAAARTGNDAMQIEKETLSETRMTEEDDDELDCPQE